MSMISPLKNSTFRSLFLAQSINLLGTGLTTVALALLAYDLSGDQAGMVLGTALALKMIAYIGIAPIVGGYSHRLPRKQFLILLNIIRGIMVLGLPFVDSITQIYLIIFLINACSAAYTPIFQATIPDIIPEEKTYTEALSLSRLAYDLENLLSPLLAAVALLVLTYNSLFVINTLTFVLAAFLIINCRFPPITDKSTIKDSNSHGFVQTATLGIRYYLKTPRLRGLLALSLAAAAASAMVIINTVVYVREYFQASETETALAFTASGAGSMIIALLLPKLLTGVNDKAVMTIGGLALTVGLYFGSLLESFTELLMIWFLIGIGLSLIQTPAGRLLKRSANDEDRPALFSAHFSLSHACWLLCYPLAGWLGTQFNPEAAAWVLATISFGATFCAFILWPSDDQPSLEHQHAAFSHEHMHYHDEHHKHHHANEVFEEPHSHFHHHQALKHSHRFVIDAHHQVWPSH